MDRGYKLLIGATVLTGGAIVASLIQQGYEVVRKGSLAQTPALLELPGLQEPLAVRGEPACVAQWAEAHQATTVRNASLFSKTQGGKTFQFLRNTATGEVYPADQLLHVPCLGD